MEFWKPTLFLIGGIGVINGMVFSLLLLFTRNTKLENTFLGLLLLMICIRIGKSIYFYFTDHIDNLILQIGLSACVFIGPLFFLYTKTVNRHFNKTPKAYKVLLATIGIGIITVGLIYPYRTFPDLWNGPIIRSIYLIWGSFVLLGFIEIRVIITNAFHHFPQLTASQKRLLLISGGILIITLSYEFAYWIEGFTYLWGSLIFTALFYYLMLMEVRHLLRPQERKKPASNTPLEKGAEMLERVESAMQEQQLYKQPSLKLKDLAKATGLQTHLLSRLLNEVYPHGFATYVHEKRIEEAKKLIRSETNYTLEGIGYESGFNSKSSFYATFKKLTGYTPAEYKSRETINERK